jgi:hypothetical protein
MATSQDKAPKIGEVVDPSLVASTTPIKSGLARKTADLPLGLVSGALGATASIADAFGADNVVARGLKGISKGADSLLSPEAKVAQMRQGEILDEAKGKGFGEQLVAGGKAFMEAPLQTTVHGVGSVAPFLATSLIPGGAAATAARVGMGLGMGAGAVKGSINEEVTAREIAAGKTPEQAAATAEAAQAYGGKNTDQIALGAGLGVVDAAMGVTPVATKMLRQALGKEVIEQGAKKAGSEAAEGMTKAGLMGAAKEMPVEFLQGGQEQVAANIAAQREGYSAGTFDGAFSQGALEALASAGPGAGFGIMDRSRGAQPVPPPEAPSAPVQPAVADQLGQSLTGTPMSSLMAGGGLTGAANPLGSTGNLTTTGSGYPGMNTAGPDSTVDPETGAIIPAEPGIKKWVDPNQPPAPLGGSLTGASMPSMMGGNNGLTGAPLEPIKPSEQMGLNPAAGPLSAAAVTAVDGDATPSMQAAAQAAAQQEQATQAQQQSDSKLKSSGWTMNEFPVGDEPMVASLESKDAPLFMTQTTAEDGTPTFNVRDTDWNVIASGSTFEEAAGRAKVQQASGGKAQVTPQTTGATDGVKAQETIPQEQGRQAEQDGDWSMGAKPIATPPGSGFQESTAKRAQGLKAIRERNGLNKPVALIDEGKTAPRNRDEYVAEVRRQIGDIKDGDTLTNDVGDVWTVDAIVRDKNGDITLIVPKERGDGAEGASLDIDGIGSILMPSPYTDANGERKMSGPGTVTRRATAQTDTAEQPGTTGEGAGVSQPKPLTIDARKRNLATLKQRMLAGRKQPDAQATPVQAGQPQAYAGAAQVPVKKEAQPQAMRIVVRRDITGDEFEVQGGGVNGGWEKQTTFSTADAANDFLKSRGHDVDAVETLVSEWSPKLKRFSSPKRQEPTTTGQAEQAQPLTIEEADANIQLNRIASEFVDDMRNEAAQQAKNAKKAGWSSQFTTPSERLAASDIGRYDGEKLSQVVESGRVTLDRANAMLDSAVSDGWLNKDQAERMKRMIAPAATAKQPAPTTEPFAHAGLKIRNSRVKVGDDVQNRWVVQSPENAEREARGERQIGGDRIVDTRDQAIQAAEQESKKYASDKAAKAEFDAKDAAEKEASEAKKQANRGKSIAQRRVDAILEKPSTVGQGTKREVIETAVRNGRAIVEKMVEDTAAKKRDREAVDRVSRAGYMLGLSNENIPVVKAGLEAQARLKADKYQKPEYRMYSDSREDGPFREITKTEYDYAQELKAKRAAAPIKTRAIEVAKREYEKEKNRNLKELRATESAYDILLEDTAEKIDAMAARANGESIADIKKRGEEFGSKTGGSFSLEDYTVALFKKESNAKAALKLLDGVYAEAEQIAADIAKAPTNAQEGIAAAQAKAARFAIGKSLTKEQRKQVLESLVDTYKTKGAEREFKGQDSNGNDRYGYVYSPELFEKSDITGAMVRYYVTLPDGRIAHPTELFPDVSASDVERMALEQESKEKAQEAYENAIKPFYPDFDSANLMATTGQVVISKGDRLAIIPNRIGAVNQARQQGWELAKPAPADVRRALQADMEGAVADGFVQEVNPFAEYDAVAKQYGYEVRPDGMIGKDGKFPGPKVSIQKGRLRVESGAGNLLGSYAATPESVGKFLEAFWYAEKKAVRGSAPAQQEAKNPAKAVADGFVEQAAAESDYASTAEQVEAAKELLLPIRQGEMITDDVRQTLESLLKIPSLKGFDQPTARRLLMIAGATKAAIEKVMRTNPVSIDDLATELGKATGEAEKKKAFDRAFNAASQIAQTDPKVKELLDIYNVEKSILDGIASERGLYGVKWAERNVSSRWTGQSQKVRSVKQRLVDAVNKAAPSGVRQGLAGARAKKAAEPANPTPESKTLTTSIGGSEQTLTFDKPVWEVTDAELVQAVKDSGTYLGKPGSKYDPYKLWREAQGVAIEKAQNDGVKFSDELLYDKPGLIRDDLNADDADIALDAMVDVYRATKDYGKAVQAYRDFGKADKPAEAAQPKPVKSDKRLTEAGREPEQMPVSKTPTVDHHSAVMVAVHEGKATVEQFKAGFEAAVNGADAIKAELATKTKADLLKMGGYAMRMRYANDTKPEIIDALYREILGEFVLGESLTYGMGKNSYQNAIRQRVEATDADKLSKYAVERKAAMEEYVQRRFEAAKAIANPQKLEDFRGFIRAEMLDGKTRQEAYLALSPEQRIRFDELEAESTRDARESRKRAQKTQVQAAGQTTGGQIVETKHTKTGQDLFVVQLSERLSKEDYTTVLASAKRMGGWYSAFRGNGAVPGFQFKEKAGAEAFLRLAGGDTSMAAEQVAVQRDAFDDDKTQTAAERLNEMADKLEERADEELGRERNANTARRARFAASAEAAASNVKALAKTMRNIAKAIGGGTAKFLDAVRTKTQVEMLSSMVHTAKYNELVAKFPEYSDREKRKGEPPTVETADFAEFPTFTAFRSDLATLARQMLEVDGTKKLGQQLMSVADDVTDTYLEFAKKNILAVSQFGRGGAMADFTSKSDAEAAIRRSGLVGKAIILPIKRGENRVILSPSEAMNRKVWGGDGDKRITLTKDAGMELVQAIGRKGNKENRLTVPWQFETAAERLKALSRIGIETPSEFRSAIREFIAMRVQAQEADRVKAMERAMVGRKNDGLDFFPTPAEVADQMVEAAGIEPDMAVLEPSAGMGHPWAAHGSS